MSLTNLHLFNNQSSSICVDLTDLHPHRLLAIPHGDDVAFDGSTAVALRDSPFNKNRVGSNWPQLERCSRRRRHCSVSFQGNSFRFGRWAEAHRVLARNAEKVFSLLFQILEAVDRHGRLQSDHFLPFKIRSGNKQTLLDDVTGQFCTTARSWGSPLESHGAASYVRDVKIGRLRWSSCNGIT